jgi:hypothetical protein
MWRLLSCSALAVGLAGLASCRSDVAAPPPTFNLAVATDKPQYSLATDSLALVSVTNRSDRAVYLPMDVYVVLERLRNGIWADSLVWFSVDGLSRSFPLSPAATVTDTLRLWFYLPNRPGTYRVRYFVYADPELQTLAPLEKRVSAPFTVTP